MLKERRHRSAEDSHIIGDRITKQIIIVTICGISIMLVLTMCRMAMASMAVPDPVDRLATLVVGAMIGWLGKTGIDKVMGSAGTESDPMSVTAKEPLPVTETAPAGDQGNSEPGSEM